MNGLAQRIVLDVHANSDKPAFEQVKRVELELADLQAQRDALLVAAKPFKEFADYLVAHPRTGLGDAMYGWDNEVFIRQSDLLKLREAIRLAESEQAQ